MSESLPLFPDSDRRTDIAGCLKVPKAVVELGDASEFAAALTPLFLAVPFDTEHEQAPLGHRCSRYKTVVLEIAPGPKSITRPVLRKEP
jgi:hypothetical protein